MEDLLVVMIRMKPVLYKYFRQCSQDCMLIAIREKRENYFRHITSSTWTSWYATLQF